LVELHLVPGSGEFVQTLMENDRVDEFGIRPTQSSWARAKRLFGDVSAMWRTTTSATTRTSAGE
jgi:hypothetical protein